MKPPYPNLQIVPKAVRLPLREFHTTQHPGIPVSLLNRLFNVGSSVASSSLAGWRGTACFRPAEKQPELPLVLYEYEACPFCRLVRETLTELDLDAEIRPCPRGGRRFRSEAQEIGGRMQFPLMVDPNTGTVIQDSRKIITYLYDTYCEREEPSPKLGQKVDDLRSQLGTLPRPLYGLQSKADEAPERPLELYSFESSPYSRLVREKLCELEIPYILRSTGKAIWEDMGPPEMRAALFPDKPVTGRNRTALLERTGKVQVPYLIDPNTDTEMFESADICAYLDATYGPV